MAALQLHCGLNRPAPDLTPAGSAPLQAESAKSEAEQDTAAAAGDLLQARTTSTT